MSERGVMNLLGSAIGELAHHVLSKSKIASAAGRRFILGIAGIPGSGKSTFASKLAVAAEGLAPGATRVMPMDGFHLSNQRLDELGLRLAKGSPATFDVAGYLDLLRRAKHVSDEKIQVPIYDRALHEPVLPRDEAHAITPMTQLIITEGNYLLLDEDPWRGLADVLFECWGLNTPVEQARQWIIARHVRGGREIDDAMQHYGRTDLPNTKLILAKRRTPDRVL